MNAPADPERIWLQAAVDACPREGRQWCEDKVWPDDDNDQEPTEYIRADLFTALTAERDALAGIVRGWHWLAVGPDEMGDYQHQRELIKASEPYASPALRAIAAGAHKK